MKVAKIRRQKELEEKRQLRKNKEKPSVPFKYLITLAYNGSNYGGYAKQKHKNTIQNILEDSLSTYFNEYIKTTESSRTDAKVHALSQKITFEVTRDLNIELVKIQLNELLPNDIIICDIKLVEKEFHCRHDVIDKTYEYVIHKKNDPRFINSISWYVDKPLDIDKMNEASRCLVGKHDFSTFKAAKATTTTSIRTIYSLDIIENNDTITIRINGDGFLYKMVRLVVKSLVDVGIGKEDISYIKKLLDLKAKPDHLESAPAQGLTLIDINYKRR